MGDVKIWNMEYSHAVIIKVSNVAIHIFKLSNSKHNWLQLSTVENFMKLVDLSDLSKGVCKHKLWSKKIYSEGVLFLTDVLPS